MSLFLDVVAPAVTGVAGVNVQNIPGLVSVPRETETARNQVDPSAQQQDQSDGQQPVG
jgi:hypothetical protein